MDREAKKLLRTRVLEYFKEGRLAAGATQNDPFAKDIEFGAYTAEDVNEAIRAAARLGLLVSTGTTKDMRYKTTADGLKALE